MQVQFTLRMSEIITYAVTTLQQKKWSRDISNITSASVSFELRYALGIWPCNSHLTVLMSGKLYCYCLKSIYELLRNSDKCDAPHISSNSGIPSVSPCNCSSFK